MRTKPFSVALKPSLVEWKLYCITTDREMWTFLETFLSGMETGQAIQDYPCIHPLKPSLVEWKRFNIIAGSGGPIFLETFLSGMETRGGADGQGAFYQP